MFGKKTEEQKEKERQESAKATAKSLTEGSPLQVILRNYSENFDNRRLLNAMNDLGYKAISVSFNDGRSISASTTFLFERMR